KEEIDSLLRLPPHKIGVYTANIDVKQKKVTVVGNVEPWILIKKSVGRSEPNLNIFSNNLSSGCGDITCERILYCFSHL
ncbi:unnamed protein product, partial [Brassica rapa]